MARDDTTETESVRHLQESPQRSFRAANLFLPPAALRSTVHLKFPATVHLDNTYDTMFRLHIR